MPSKTWKTIADQRRKENFVGRAEQLLIFTENFTSNEPAWMVLSITGEGGVGKSTLLKRYLQEAQRPEINANVVICDDHHYTPVDVMAAVAEQLEKLGIESKNFNERYKKYRETLQQIESDPNAPRGMVNVVTRGLTDFAVKSLRRTPGIGVAMDYVDEKAAGDALAELAQYTLTRWGNKDEVLLVREPEKILTPLFVDLLNEAAEKKRLVVMFDVFERTATTLSAWLLALFNSQYGEIAMRVSFLLSGRDPLEQHWTELAGLIAYLQLEPFNSEETATYLHNRDITDEALVKQIHQDTGGLPVLVALLADTNPQPNSPLSDISKNAVDRFLQWTPDEMRNIALLAAVPRQFNQDVLAAILGEDAARMFEWLSGQSYIRSDTARGWFYHEKVRELMLRYQARVAPLKLAEAHGRLSDYFLELQKTLGAEANLAYDNEQWLSWELERIYHSLNKLPQIAFEDLVSVFLPAFLYASDFSLYVFLTFEQLCSERSFPWNNLEIFLNLIAAKYDNNYGEMISILNALSGAVKLKPAIKKVLLISRGLNFWLAGSPNEAISDFSDAIALYNQDASIYFLRGVGLGTLQNYQAAISDFTKVLELSDNFSLMALAYRGAAFEALDDFKLALADYSEAIQQNSSMAYLYIRRGLTYLKLGDQEKFIADLNQAIKLDPTNHSIVRDFGLTLMQAGEFELALEQLSRYIETGEEVPYEVWVARGICFGSQEKESAIRDINQAILMQPENPSAIAVRGSLYLDLRRIKEALLDFENVLRVNPDADKKAREMIVSALGEALIDGVEANDPEKFAALLVELNKGIELGTRYSKLLIAARAFCYAAQEKFAEALVDFDQTKLEVEEFMGVELVYETFLSFRAAIYFESERLLDAIPDYSKLIEIDPSDSQYFSNRAMCYFYTGQYPQAQRDLEKAIQIDGKNTVLLAFHGQVCNFLGDLTQAIKDLDRAIKIDKTDSLLFVQRGHTYRKMGKYEAAIKDFEHSLKLNPTDIDAFSGLAWTYRRLGNLRLAEKSLYTAMSIEVTDLNCYDGAIALVLANQIPEALIELERAFTDLQFRTIAVHDDLLDPIRDLPEFKALFAKYG